MLRLVLAVLSLVLATSPVLSAPTPQKIGTFGAWTVWKYPDQSRMKCFIYSNPSNVEPARLDHGLVSFFIRRTKSTDARTEASLQVGYTLAPEAALDVDGQAFPLQTVDKGAWLARTGPRERDLLEAMRQGRSMTVSAASARGNATRYVFPLQGVTAAMTKLRSVCP